MAENSPSDDRLLRVPTIVWVLGGGLFAALVAILVFNVAVSTVIYYGFFALMMGSHFFMHGSHGGHASHQHGSTSDNTDSSKNEHTRHTDGCH